MVVRQGAEAKLRLRGLDIVEDGRLTEVDHIRSAELAMRVPSADAEMDRMKPRSLGNGVRQSPLAADGGALMARIDDDRLPGQSVGLNIGDQEGEPADLVD